MPTLPAFAVMVILFWSILAALFMLILSPLIVRIFMIRRAVVALESIASSLEYFAKMKQFEVRQENLQRAQQAAVGGGASRRP